MGERLIVKRDRLVVDRRAHRLGELARRQLPQAAEQAVGGPARQHDAAGLLDPHHGAREDRQLGLLLARRDHRQLVLPSGPCRVAIADQGADQAARLGRRTHRRAELHEALVQRAGRCPFGEGVHQLTGRGPQRLAAGSGLDVVFDREHARQDARDVAIDERGALAERDRGDRARGVRADPGHLAQLGRARWQGAAVARTDLAGAGMQVAGARVVAEAGPRGEDVVERRLGERRDGREPGHPALPVRDHRRDPGLLQHDLADPDRVGVAGAPPRQVALDLREVTHHRGRDRVMPVHATSYRARATAATAGSVSAPRPRGSDRGSGTGSSSRGTRAAAR